VTLNKQSLASSADDRVTLRGFLDETDFEIIAHVDQEPVGFVFVARTGGPQLDEFGTIEGRSWLFIGPTCIPVGTVAVVRLGNRGELATLAVIPSFQRRGIGSLLMERAIDHAWRSGIRTIGLAVRAENRQAINIYTRFGFQIIPQQTTVVLVKDL
jgi:ribosomal protein S18 acetylase RimI-like enzyme